MKWKSCKNKTFQNIQYSSTCTTKLFYIWSTGIYRICVVCNHGKIVPLHHRRLLLLFVAHWNHTVVVQLHSHTRAACSASQCILRTFAISIFHIAHTNAHCTIICLSRRHGLEVFRCVPAQMRYRIHFNAFTFISTRIRCGKIYTLLNTHTARTLNAICMCYNFGMWNIWKKPPTPELRMMNVYE